MMGILWRLPEKIISSGQWIEILDAKNQFRYFEKLIKYSEKQRRAIVK